MTDPATRPMLLLVDDAPEILDVLRQILGAEFRLKVATGGERALKIAQSAEPPDLIVLDVNMPGLDGFSLCRRLRESGNPVPIVILTSRDGEIDEALGLEPAAGQADPGLGQVEHDADE